MSAQSLARIVEILSRFVEQTVVDDVGTVKVLVRRGNRPEEVFGCELLIDGGRGWDVVGILVIVVGGRIVLFER